MGKEDIIMPKIGYVFVQSALLFCVYGLNYNLPYFVKWFPTLIYLISLPVLCILAIIGAILKD